MKNILSLLILFFSTFSQSADMQVYADRSGNVIMYFNGEITSNDAYKFVFISEEWKRNGLPIGLVSLNSNGGSVYSSYEIANYMVKNNISTYVGEGSYCLSACFNIFLSGSPRYAEPKSRVGVHRVSYNSYDTAGARSSSIDMNDFFRAFNVPANIRLAMLETEPRNMYYLTLKDKENVSTYKPNRKQAEIVFSSGGVKNQETRNNNSNKSESRKLNSQAIKLIHSGNYTQAIRLLEKAKSLSPSDAEILGNLGHSYSKIANYNLAQINLTAALKIKPKRGATWGDLAVVLADIGNLDWSVESFVNYWNYSSKKDLATEKLYAQSRMYPNSNRDFAARRARQLLGL